MQIVRYHGGEGNVNLIAKIKFTAQLRFSALSSKFITQGRGRSFIVRNLGTTSPFYQLYKEISGWKSIVKSERMEFFILRYFFDKLRRITDPFCDLDSLLLTSNVAHDPSN